MAARIKITGVWPARDTDRENVLGHFSFVWKPDPDFEQIIVQRLVKDDEGKYSRRDHVQIDGATMVRVKVADVMEYQDRETGETKLFVGVDGLSLRREISAQLLGMVQAPLAEARAKLRAGEIVLDSEAANAAPVAGEADDSDIPF